MRDFPGFRPFEIGDYTDEELAALMNDQDARWKAIRDAERKQKRNRRG